MLEWKSADGMVATGKLLRMQAVLDVEQSRNSGHPLAVGAAYRVSGQLEVVGRTKVGLGYRASTREVSPRGARLSCAACVPSGVDVRLRLVAPDGLALSASGTIVQSRAADPDGETVGGSELLMIFDVEQPRLSRSRIRAAA